MVLWWTHIGRVHTCLCTESIQRPGQYFGYGPINTLATALGFGVVDHVIERNNRILPEWQT